MPTMVAARLLTIGFASLLGTGCSTYYGSPPPASSSDDDDAFGVDLAGCGSEGNFPLSQGENGLNALKKPVPPASEDIMWVLVHPSIAPDGAGIHVYNKATGETLDVFPLPTALLSPHALAFDGTSLWLSGYSEDEFTLYEVDPTDGSILSALVRSPSEGIAVDEDTLWIGPWFGEVIQQITKDGTVLDEVFPSTIVSDLTFDGTALYYIANSATDPVIKIDIATGAETIIAEPATPTNAPYSLSFDGTYLVAADGNNLRRLDPVTGDTFDLIPLNVRGWITAIAFSVPDPDPCPGV